jgi:hypothetical protein
VCDSVQKTSDNERRVKSASIATAEYLTQINENQGDRKSILTLE